VRSGRTIRRKPEEIYDNSFMNNLEKRRFWKEIWGVRITGTSEPR